MTDQEIANKLTELLADEGKQLSVTIALADTDGLTFGERATIEKAIALNKIRASVQLVDIDPTTVNGRFKKELVKNE